MGACSIDAGGGLPSIPVLEFPSLDLPGCQGLQPPLLPAVRRPMTETRGFLDHRLRGGPYDATADLPRRFADHIDEFGLVGHRSVPRELPSRRSTSLPP